MISLRLDKCPNKKNCVCSKDSRESYYIGPLELNLNPIEKVSQKLNAMGLKVVTKEKNYIHAVATSSFFKFKDDLELLYDEEKKLLHFRSASRTGYSDLGVNRKRVESLKKILK